MRARSRTVVVVGSILALAAARLAAEPRAEPAATLAARAAPRSAEVRLEENRGQTDPSVAALARCGGYLAWIRPADVVFAFPAAPAGHDGLSTDLVRLRFAGAAERAPESAEPRPGVSNYLCGNDPTKWVRGVRSFGRVAFRAVWPGVDVRYVGQGAALGFEFDVAAGADEDAVAIAIDGATTVATSAGGALVATTARGTVRISPPVAYETDGGARRALPARWTIRDANVAAFEIAGRDPSKALTIDPTVTYSTLLGGSANETPESIDLDAAGNAFVGGYTLSSDFPVTAGAFAATYNGTTDGYVSKFNATGTSLAYSTYIGGTGNDQLLEISYRTAGNDLFLAGQTASSDFPVVQGGIETTKTASTAVGFVTRLAASGSSLVFSTFINYGRVEAMVGDVPGQCHFVSLPPSGGTPKLYSLAPTGDVALYAVTPGTGTALASGIAVAKGGSVVVCGTGTVTTTSGAYRTTPYSGTDSWVWRVDSSGVTVYTTYLGGSGNDLALACGADDDANAYVTGWTSSPDFPTVDAVQPTAGSAAKNDAFLAKLNPSGTGLVFSTYIGGTGDEAATGLAVTPAAVYVVGDTTSTDLPVTPNAIQPNQASPGSYDGMIAVFRPYGTKSMLTYFGGSSIDSARAVVAAPAPATDIHVHVRTSSNDFPTTPGAYDSARSATDGAVVRIANAASPYAITDHAFPSLTVGGSHAHQFATTDGNGTTTFSVATGSLPTGFSLSAAGAVGGNAVTPGTYAFSVRAVDEAGIGVQRDFTWRVNALPSVPSLPEQLWTRGRPFTTQLPVNGGTAPFTWTTTAGALPSGLTLGADGTVTGTAASAGTSSVTVKVSDVHGIEAAGSFTFRMLEPPAIVTSLPATITENAPYFTNVAAALGLAPYTFALEPGGLLPFTSGNIGPSNGLLGLKTRPAGTYAFTLRVTDALGATSTRDYTIVLTEGPTIDTYAFPPAAAGRSYRTTLAVHGGNTPGAWTVTFRPTIGLTFDAATASIEGTTPAKGESAVQIDYLDAYSSGDTKTLPIVVAPVADLGKRKWSASESFTTTGPRSRRHALELVAGTALSLVVKPKTSRDPAVSVTLLDAAGAPVPLGDAAVVTGNVFVLDAFVVPASGRYFLVVTAAPGAAQTVNLAAKLTQAKVVSGTVHLEPGAQPVDVPFDAPIGSSLTIAVKRAPGSVVVPAIVELTQDGADVLAPGSIKGVLSLVAKASVRPGTPALVLRLAAGASAGGDVVWTVKVKQAKRYDAGLEAVPAGD